LTWHNEKGDWLKLGNDLQDHICNTFHLGEKDRRRFYRKTTCRHKREEAITLLHQQTLLMTMHEWDAFRFKAVKKLELLETKRDTRACMEACQVNQTGSRT
jgi:hypothetical protein